MNPDLTKSLTLLENISDRQLYTNLIKQLNKDCMLAGIRVEFDLDLTPTQLVGGLRDTLQDLMNNRFDEFLNLLYVVDLSEMKIKNLETRQSEPMADEISYLLLKRLWKKVWFKQKLS